jgi:small subunit ribosomal protein S16
VRANIHDKGEVLVKIRLKRMGTTKRPFYRLVVADSRSPRDGRFIEALGFYDPLPQPAAVRIDADRVREWLRRGARPSDSARDLLVAQGILAAGPRRERASAGLATAEPEVEAPEPAVPAVEAEVEAPEPAVRAVEAEAGDAASGADGAAFEADGAASEADGAASEADGVASDAEGASGAESEFVSEGE